MAGDACAKDDDFRGSRNFTCFVQHFQISR